MKLNNQRKSPRIVMVLSRVNYVPGNSMPLIKAVSRDIGASLAGVVFVETIQFSLFISVGWLLWAGCYRSAWTLIRNICSVIWDPRIRHLSSLSIPVYVVRSVNDPKALQILKSLDPDVIINVRTRNIYKEQALTLPTFGCFNIHHGLLPKYRGMYCDLYALAEGRRAGISFHRMTGEIDSGPILYTRVLSNPGEKDYLHYLHKTHQAEADCVKDLVNYIRVYGHPPKGRPNSCKLIVYTRTPDRRQIRSFICEGLKL